MTDTFTFNLTSALLIVFGMIQITRRTMWGVPRVATWCTFAITSTILPAAFTETRTEQIPLFLTAGILLFYFFFTVFSKTNREQPLLHDDGRLPSEKVFIGILTSASILLVVFTATEKILDQNLILLYGIVSAVALCISTYNFTVELKIHHTTSFRGWAYVLLGFAPYSTRYIWNMIKIMHQGKELMWYEGILSMSLIFITLTLCFILYARVIDVAKAFFDDIKTTEDSMYS